MKRSSGKRNGHALSTPMAYAAREKGSNETNHAPQNCK